MLELHASSGPDANSAYQMWLHRATASQRTFVKLQRTIPKHHAGLSVKPLLDFSKHSNFVAQLEGSRILAVVRAKMEERERLLGEQVGPPPILWILAQTERVSGPL